MFLSECSELLTSVTTVTDLNIKPEPVYCIWTTINTIIQCESKNFIPLRFSETFFPTTENFKAKFYKPIVCTYLCQTTKFYLIISKFDKVMPYSAQPPS